jgi:hypothetical protein
MFYGVVGRTGISSLEAEEPRLKVVLTKVLGWMEVLKLTLCCESVASVLRTEPVSVAVVLRSVLGFSDLG